MKLASCEQMRRLDAAAITKYHIPGIVLMENAALSLFEACKAILHYGKNGAVVFCGTGNNGGDGFALARHMHNNCANVYCVLVGDESKIRGDALVNLEICRHSGVAFLKPDGEELNRVLAAKPLVVDAILGTGVNGELSGAVRDAVGIINDSGCSVLAVDCPTGGNPDDGTVSGVCVKAEITVSLALCKPGLLLYPLAEYAGKVIIASIGVPRKLTDSFETGLYATDKEFALRVLPVRKQRSHKGSFGKTVIIAGSQGMAGAAALCARAAYRAGCGYVVLCVPEGIVPVLQQLVPQALCRPLPERDGRLCAAALDAALAASADAEVCLIGPGLGRGEETDSFVRSFIKAVEKPLVLDADALNALQGTPQMLAETVLPPVITPHPAEMSRLSEIPVPEILKALTTTAKNFSEKYNCVTLLKDAVSVISDGKTTYINAGACSALAKAGSGDILAGLLAGFMSQGVSGTEAAALAAYIHSQAGMKASELRDEYSVSAEDLLNAIAPADMLNSGG